MVDFLLFWLRETPPVQVYVIANLHIPKAFVNFTNWVPHFLAFVADTGNPDYSIFVGLELLSILFLYKNDFVDGQ